MKKRTILASVMAMTLVLSLFTIDSASALSQNEKTGGTAFRSGNIISYEAMIENIASIENISTLEAENRIPDIVKEKNQKSEDGTEYNYLYLTNEEDDESSKMEVELFSIVWYRPNAVTMKTGMSDILFSNVKWVGSGSERLFSGTFLTHMKSSFQIHWNVKGDWFSDKTVEMNTEGDRRLEVGDYTVVNFSLNGKVSSQPISCSEKGYITFGL